MEGINITQLLEEKKKLVDSQELKGIEDNLEDIHKEIKQLKSEVYHVFAVLERPLKKYARMALDKTVADYVEDCFSTLISDTGLRIIHIFEALLKQIESGKISDKKSDKIIEMIKGHDKDYFLEKQTRNKLLSEKLKNAEKIKEECKIYDEIESKEREISSAKLRKIRLIEEITKLEEDIHMDSSKGIHEIKRKVEMVLGQEIKLLSSQ